METATKTSRVTDVTAFLDEARERYKFGLMVDQVDRKAAEDDNRFANASDEDKGQWDKEPKDQRIEASRPVLQWNRIPTYVQQVVNDGRQNKPAIKISAADGGQPETAHFFQSRIRHIEYECNADTAYDTVRDQQVTSGRGFIRVATEYVPGTFRQRLCIEPIENQFSVVCDPAAKQYDRSDAEWWFVVSRISKEKHKRDYGEDSTVNRTEFSSLANQYPEWIGVGDKNDLIQIAEYWRKEYRKRKLLLLEAQGNPELGQVPIWEDELPEGMEQWLVRNQDGTPRFRFEQSATIVLYVINGAEILSEHEWIGSSIPIVPVWGRTAVVDGRRRTFSLIRNAKDPQRLVNLYVSNIAEQIAMMPKAPYEAPVGSIAKNHEEAWQKSGSDPKAILYYIEWDENGKQLSRPSRIINEPPIQALSEGLQQAIDGIKSSMGIFDASLGARSNEVSGVAINQRRKSADILNFHFPDNEARSRKRIGEILVELIPLIDMVGTSVPIRSLDGKTTQVPIGKPHMDAKTGREVTHILTDGDYGVTVSTGPSHESARQEENEFLTKLVQAAPELMNVVGDKVIATSDTPNSEELAARMKKWIQIHTPQLIEDDKEGQGQQLPPEVQQKLQADAQELQQVHAFAQSLQEQLATKQPEIDSKERMQAAELDFEREKLAVNEKIEMAKLGVSTDVKHLEAEIESIKHAQQLDHEKDLQAMKANADTQSQAAEQDHAQSLQDGNQAHEAGMQDAGHRQALEQGQQAADLASESAGATK